MVLDHCKAWELRLGMLGIIPVAVCITVRIALRLMCTHALSPLWGTCWWFKMKCGFKAEHLLCSVNSVAFLCCVVSTHWFWMFENVWFGILKISFVAEDDERSLLFFTKDMFITIREFEKLERLEFGGTKGAVLNAQIRAMSQEFLECRKVFQESVYDPSDCDDTVIRWWLTCSTCILRPFTPGSLPLQSYNRA